MSSALKKGGRGVGGDRGRKCKEIPQTRSTSRQKEFAEPLLVTAASVPLV